MSARAPVIIIGMHRSGTSLVTRLLEQLGLFVGQEKDTNNEALLFQELNEWILCQAGATWDNPLPTAWLAENEEGCDLIVEYLQFILKSPASQPFWGRWNHVRYRAGFGLGIPWGWKDPRNTFTLPLWLKLFPDAKVMHVRRNGVDVTQSLKRRADERREKMRDAFQILGSSKTMPPFGARAVEPPRCLTLEGGFSLWEEYMAAATGHVQRFDAQAKEIGYEDLLANPVPILRNLAEFCGLKSPQTMIEAVCAEIRTDRAFAHRDDEEQRIFAASVAERLKAFGY